MSYLMNFFGRKDDKALIQKTIIDLRQQVNTLEKKEEFYNKKIEEEERTARENAVGKKKNVALAALKNKKRLENDLVQIAGKKEVLERQLSAIEDANLNKEVFKTMQRSGEVLKTIHGGLTVDKVDSIMSSINEQREIANEISEAISNPLNNGIMMEDEDELKNELAELEQDVLNERLAGAEHVPTTSLASPLREEAPSRRVAIEEDEDAELKALQAELAM